MGWLPGWQEALFPVFENICNCNTELTLGNRGQVKRRVRTHARTCTPPSPPPPPPPLHKEFAPRTQNLYHTSSDSALFLPLSPRSATDVKTAAGKHVFERGPVGRSGRHTFVEPNPEHCDR
jgi:hypothetical protein